MKKKATKKLVFQLETALEKTYLNVTICERERKRSYRSHLSGHLSAGKRTRGLLLLLWLR